MNIYYKKSRNQTAPQSSKLKRQQSCLKLYPFDWNSIQYSQVQTRKHSLVFSNPHFILLINPTETEKVRKPKKIKRKNKKNTMNFDEMFSSLNRLRATANSFLSEYEPLALFSIPILTFFLARIVQSIFRVVFEKGLKSATLEFFMAFVK